MKIRFILGLIILFLFLPETFASQTEQANLSNSISFKATIIVDNEEIEWEYENPDEYEKEKGQTVIKGNEAKQDVEQLFNKLNIHKDANVEDYVKIIKQLGYKDFDKLDVRWINEDSELFTWVWTKSK